MGCASTTPMLVDGPANGVLKSLESSAGSVAGSMIHKVEQEVGDAASKIAQHAKQEIAKVMSGGSSLASNVEPDIVKAMEDMEEELQQRDVQLQQMERASTPAMDDVSTGIMEEPMPQRVAEASLNDEPGTITTALAELEQNLPPAKTEEPETPMATETVEEEPIKMLGGMIIETIDQSEMPPSQKTEEKINMMEEKTNEMMTETKTSGAKTPMPTLEVVTEPEAPVIDFGDTPNNPSLLTVPIGSDMDSEGSDLDFHMSLEDMEMLEAQLRALTTPPPLGELNEDDDDDQPMIETPAPEIETKEDPTPAIVTEE